MHYLPKADKSSLICKALIQTITAGSSTKLNDIYSHLNSHTLAEKNSLTCLTLFAAAILLMGVSSAAATTPSSYYVSANYGNDAWSGLLASPNPARTDGPFQTLARAQAGMRSSSIKSVLLRAGTYPIGSGVNLDWADSGEQWTSYTGEAPVLDGGNVGVITMTGVNNVLLKGLTLQNMGAQTMIFNGAQMIALRWNRFSKCNLECINGSALTNSVIDSNTFNGQYPGNPPGDTTTAYSVIRLGYGSSNNQITHNLMENCQGGGIAFAAGPTDPPNSNNILDRNLLLNVNTNVFDMGALYMYDRSHAGSGNQITNNVINGNGGANYLTNQTKSIYLDVGTSNVLVSGNACRSCGEFAYQIHGGDHNTIVNNIFDLSASGMIALYQVDPTWNGYGMTQNVFRQNIVYLNGSLASSLYLVNIGQTDSIPTSQTNLYYATNGSPIPNGPLVVDSTPVYADPSLSWPANMFSLAPSSNAFNSIGFQPLPTDQGPLPGGPLSTLGSLSGSGTNANTTANLTAEGTTDWAHWGTGSITRKRSTASVISNYSVVGSGPSYYYTNDPRAVSFADGTSPVIATVNDGVFICGQNGLSFTAPADTTQRTLSVHVGGYNSSGTLSAHLSDGSAVDFVDTTSVAYGQYDRNYTLIYRATAAGQTITVKWMSNSSDGNVTLNGAALR